MSFSGGLVKMAINMTPDFLVRWVANVALKGIAELSEFEFDLDARTVYVQFTLYGETQPIEIFLEDFGILTHEEGHHMLLRSAKSNRPWMQNLLGHVTGKHIKIPHIPQLHGIIDLTSEVFSMEEREGGDND